MLGMLPLMLLGMLPLMLWSVGKLAKLLTDIEYGLRYLREVCREATVWAR